MKGWSRYDKRFSVFYELFKELNVDRPRLDGVSFMSLSMEDNFSLTSPFLLKEDDDVVSQCDGIRVGLNGINFSFFKRF